MVEKTDWEGILKKTEDDLAAATKAHEMVVPQFNHMIEFYKKKISEFPESDPMPEEVKDIVDAVK